MLKSKNCRTGAWFIAAVVANALWSLPAQADMEKIKKSGVLSVAVYKGFTPFSDTDKSVTKGIDVDIAQALADKLGLKLSLLPFDAGEDMGDDLRNMVWKGHYLGYGPANVMMHVPVDKAFMAKNDNALIFGEYYREAIVMLRDTQKIPDLNGVTDLQGQQLAAERGTAAASALLGADGGTMRSNVHITNTLEDAVGELQAGKVAAVYGSRAALEARMQRLKLSAARYSIGKLQLNGVPSRGWVVGMAVKRSERDVAKALEDGLRALETDGTLNAIFTKYGVARVKP